MGLGFEFGENPLVLPQVGEVLPEGDGGHGEQGAVEEPGRRRGPGGGEMVAVVIDRAKAGENEGASFKSPGEFGGAKEFRNREALALDEYGIDPGKVWKAKVPPVARKNYRAGVRVQGTCFRVEPANKKLVETCEGIRRVGEFGRIEAEIPDKRAHEGPAGGTIHPAAIPPGKKRSLDQVPQEGTDRVFVGEA